MGKFRLRIGLMLSLAIWSQAGWALDQDVDDEFEIKRQYELDKIEDFYTRLNDLDRLDAERRSGENEMRKERKEIWIENEAARQEFVKQRKVRPPEDSSSWEKEIKARALEHDLARKAFVKRRDDMNKALKGLGKISEEDEYDLGSESAE